MLLINDFVKDAVIQEIENSLLGCINDCNKKSQMPLISKDYPQIPEILNKRANEIYDFVSGFMIGKLFTSSNG